MEAPSGERLRGKDAGLVESNGSLPLGDDLKSHLLADCLYTGISYGPNARYGRTILLFFTINTALTIWCNYDTKYDMEQF